MSKSDTEKNAMAGLRFKDADGVFLSVTDWREDGIVFNTHAADRGALSRQDAERLHKWLGKWLERQSNDQK